MAEPFLSICVMTYNRQRTLVETLDSLLPQVAERQDVEIVVCDNASEDGTDTFIQVYLTRFPALRYHRNQTNLGFDGNVVTCVEQARGEYVAFFSDDDLAPPGHVEKLLTELHSKKPCILYLNHIPFFHHDVRQLGKPLSPFVRQEFTNGREFILLAGMGFISALIVQREKALPFLGKVIRGAGEAHLDIAYRMALSYSELFIYNGMISVYGRYEYGGPPILIAGCVNIARLYRSLVAEGLMDQPTFDRWLRGQIRSVVPRHVFSARGRDRGVHPLRGMIELYGRMPAFYSHILPLYLIPGPIIRMLYRVSRFSLHKFRRWRHRSS